MDRILVWDLPTRIGHWLLAACFAVAWLTSESESMRLIHVMAGGTLVGVVAFRIAWGLLGSTYARFDNFVRAPAAAWRYLADLTQGRPAHFVGHNPAGGYAILALLSLGLFTGLSGWLNYQEIGGEWLEEGHEAMASLMLAVVGVHLAGVAIGSWRHRENLPRAMVTGHKSGRPESAIPGARAASVITLLACAALAAWLLSR